MGCDNVETCRPTSLNPEPEGKEIRMDRYECPCGYIYDPAEGDAERNIPIGTAFEDLPDDWVCPLCGAEKEYFENLLVKWLQNPRSRSRARRRAN